MVDVIIFASPMILTQDKSESWMAAIWLAYLLRLLLDVVRLYKPLTVVSAEGNFRIRPPNKFGVGEHSPFVSILRKRDS